MDAPSLINASMVSAVTIAQSIVPILQHVMPLELAVLEMELAPCHANHAHSMLVTTHHHALKALEPVMPSECVSIFLLLTELYAMTMISVPLEITALLELALETPLLFAKLLTNATMPVFATLKLEIAQTLLQPTRLSATTATNAPHLMFAFLVFAQDNTMFNAMPLIAATKLEPATPSPENAQIQTPTIPNRALMETFAQYMIPALKDYVLDCQ